MRLIPLTSIRVIVCFCCALSVSAAQSSEIKKLILSQEQRDHIQAERLKLKEKNGLKPRIFASKNQTKIVNRLKKTGVVLPKKMVISSIILNPEKEIMVRINGKYQKKSYKGVNISSSNSQPEAVILNLKGKQVTVLVGETYLTKNGKVVSTYRMNKPNKLKKLNMKPVPQTVDSNNELAAGISKQLKLIQAISGKN